MKEYTQQQLYRKSLLIVVIAQIFGGAGLAAGITVGALLAQEMLGTDSVTGLPTALFTLGSAGSALLVGRLSQRFGRRIGLSTGFLLGGIGAIGVIVAALYSQVILLFASLLVYGAGTATNLQARYAATDLADSGKRATAISISMVSTTLGAVAGPNLVEVMGEFASGIGIPRLAGPFILAAAAFLLAGLVLILFLRPDPLLTALELARKHEAGSRSGSAVPINGGDVAPLQRKLVIAGAAVMLTTQIVMVAIMTMTPIHMKHHGHGLGDVGMVIGIHVAAMFLPSLITGVLVDKLGRMTMIVASGITLLASGVLAAAAPPHSMPLLTLALALLGLGWNFGLISGTTLIVDATTPANRAKTQGSVDVLIALAGASSGAMSGMIVAGSSYAVLSLAGGILSLILIPVVVWTSSRPRGNSTTLNG
ncbi:MFS transporter [Paenibacillus sp. J5C_2022]|uniref:MFS transporter n=1 Tax=Paenibacillus sp. J5C2022 TaxID=2977129 RepID=UPI0021CFC6CE|nr:MFS transporter [Paenibacillus sp. J5C2022]MCU6709169.1 MFS transporter [Paenibacillus sp. J5C2022]